MRRVAVINVLLTFLPVITLFAIFVDQSSEKNSKVNISAAEKKMIEEQTVFVKAEDSILDVSTKMLFYFDEYSKAYPKSKKIDINQVTKLSEAKFKPTRFRPPVFKQDKIIIWVKLSIDLSGIDQKRYFYIENFLIKRINVYFPQKRGGYQKTEGGKEKPLSLQKITLKHNIFSIPLRTGKHTVYFEIDSPEDGIEFQVHIVDAIGLSKLTSKKSFFIGMYSTVAYVLLLFNILVFLVTRNRTYLYYSAHLLAFSSIMLSILGSFQNIFAESPYWYSFHFTNIASHLATIFSSLFAIHFLSIKRNHPKLAKYLYAANAYLCVNMFLNISHYRVTQSIFFIIIIVMSVTLLIFAARNVKINQYARYFLAAWSFHLIVIILFVLATTNLFETGIRLKEVMIGNVLEMFILTFALGLKFRSLIKEKQEMEGLMRRQLQKEYLLQKKADIDHLTGVYNRRKIEEVFNTVINSKNVRIGALSMIVFDIDNFKLINDNYGHVRGDKILKNFTKVLSRLIRKTDILSRYGGEEFIIIVQKAEANEAFRIAESIRKEVAKTIHVATNKRVTTSGGIAQYKEGDTFESLFQRADKAMYTAKKNGRNRVEMAT